MITILKLESHQNETGQSSTVHQHIDCSQADEKMQQSIAHLLSKRLEIYLIDRFYQERADFACVCRMYKLPVNYTSSDALDSVKCKE